MSYGCKRFEEFSLGDEATYTRTITEADLALFAELSGDRYPLHVDDAYAAASRFGKRVVTGAMLAGLMSAANGLLLQRPGGMMVAQNLRYLRPCFVGDTITATSAVIGISAEERRLKFRTTCHNQNGELVADGTAVGQKDEA